MATSAPEFFVSLLHGSTQAHILHLKTKSYAAHKALEGLYKGLPELADELVEAYQGLNGVVATYPAYSVTPADDAVEFVQSLRALIDEARDSVGKQSELQNLVDEIASLVDSTLYKLKNLK